MRNKNDCLLLRSNLLEQISIFSGEIEITIDVSRSLLDMRLFSENQQLAEKIKGQINAFISFLMEIQIENVASIEYLSSILDYSLSNNYRLQELKKIKERVYKAQDRMYKLSRNMTDDFQKMRSENEKNNIKSPPARIS